MQSNLFCFRYSKIQEKSYKGVWALHQGESLSYFLHVSFGEAFQKTSKVFYLFMFYNIIGVIFNF